MKRLALTAAVLLVAAACGPKTDAGIPAADSAAPAAMPAPATDSAAPTMDSTAAMDSTKKM
jgi:hypothetical protein